MPVTARPTLEAHALTDALVLRLLVPVATMLTIGLVALLLLFTPQWVHSALDAARAPYWLGMDNQTTHEYSDRTIRDLLFGPGTFDLTAPDGSAFYSADERAHMRDVRVVLYGFLVVAAVSAVGLAALAVRRKLDRPFMRSVGRGGSALAIGSVVVGAVALVAFDAVFELFHRLLFPGGNFSFDSSQRLVQLYPYAFWQLTGAALGVLLIAGGGAAWWLARNRARGEVAA